MNPNVDGLMNRVTMTGFAYDAAGQREADTLLVFFADTGLRRVRAGGELRRRAD